MKKIEKAVAYPRNNQIGVHTQNKERDHDNKLIQDSFADFANGKIHFEKELTKKFGKYGWGVAK